jgi:hypothetical protein
MGTVVNKGSWSLYYPANQTELDAALALPGSWPGLGCYDRANPVTARQVPPLDVCYGCGQRIGDTDPVWYFAHKHGGPDRVYHAECGQQFKDRGASE